MHCALSHRIRSKCLKHRRLRLKEPRQVVQGQITENWLVGMDLKSFCLQDLASYSQWSTASLRLCDQGSFSDVRIKYFWLRVYSLLR